jgi:hypothetical protein
MSGAGDEGVAFLARAQFHGIGEMLRRDHCTCVGDRLIIEFRATFRDQAFRFLARLGELQRI